MIRVARPEALPPSDAALVVVEASAGTGKTFFLEHRVVDLILGGAELAQILVVTFTDKAVAELRLRIRDLLDRLARTTSDTDCASHWVIDDDARRRLRAAVTAFDYAPIYTIHGFCHRLLIEDAFSARRLFDQKQVADEVAFDAAFGALLRERFAYRSPDRELLAAFLSTTSRNGAPRTVETLRKLLLACVRADAKIPRAPDPDAVCEAFAAIRGAFGTAAQREPLVALVGGNRSYTTGWLADIGAALDKALGRSDGDPSPAEQLAALDAMRHAVQMFADAKRIGKLPAAAASAIRTVVATGTLDAALAAHMVPALLERIAADKAEHGQFDYDDMLDLVWQALRGPRSAEVAARLRERTPWAMIDEFQDTDPVQWDIFREVWMHPAAKGLTIVGDPKQAIYGFRGADVDTYLHARDEMLRAGAARVVLDVNRRSSAQLVDAVNHLLVGPPLATQLLTGAITYDEPVRASGDIVCDDIRPPVTVFQLQTTARGQTDPNRVALADAIGSAIEALRAAPPVWRRRGVVQAFALGQVMVLTRTNKESSEIATALRARGLPCAVVESEKLFETREARELADMLAAIAAPRDRSLRMRALRTRFFDVPWSQLMQVVDAPDHHPAITRIFEWAQLAARRAYEPLFRRIVEDSRFAERALVLGGGERALTNTWHLLELVLAEVARSRSDLHELVAQLRRWIADDSSLTDERDVQRAETDAEAVRILTIHKAKGLEAPYVFLYGGMTAAPRGNVQTLRDAAGRALVVGKPDDALQQQLDDELEAEHQRLAYVAVTRAQIRLYVPMYSEAAVKERAMYQPIQRCLGHCVGPKPATDPTLFATLAVPVGAPEPAPAPPDALDGFVPPAPPPPAELAPLAAARGGLAMLSYTRLAHGEPTAQIAARAGDALAIDPAEFDVDDRDPPPVAPLSPDELPPGASSGLLLHDVLEVADLAAVRGAADLAAWYGDPAVAELVADKARERGIAPRCTPHAAAIVHRTLSAPLALVDGTTLPPLVAAPAFAREVEFSYPLPVALPGGSPRGLVKGYIDALVAWDSDLWVLDYKSDLLAQDDLVAAAQRRVREHYAIQARLYALAADRMRGSRRLAGLLFAFVRHDIVVPVRIDDDALASWSGWLADVERALYQEVSP